MQHRTNQILGESFHLYSSFFPLLVCHVPYRILYRFNRAIKICVCLSSYYLRRKRVSYNYDVRNALPMWPFLFSRLTDDLLTPCDPQHRYEKRISFCIHDKSMLLLGHLDASKFESPTENEYHPSALLFNVLFSSALFKKLIRI